MKSIYSWQDFRKYGIDILTGESCGLGMRLLADVNADGWKLLDEFFGNTHSKNWDRLIAKILEDLPYVVAEEMVNDPWAGKTWDAIKRRLDTLRETTECEWQLLPRGQGVNTDDPASGSILLPRSIFEDLATFCLLHEPDVYAVVILPSVHGMQGGIYGMDKQEYDHWNERREVWEGDVQKRVHPVVYMKSSQPGNGFRNTHFFGGFTET